ncbi:helix-turn-helix domain-containing protein [Candidatus Gracilibacteria bacterium]|nr:helix-turn-helix domain-containing protein [Candidatus Gracilibacteria bacterium]
MKNGYAICMNEWIFDKDIKNELNLLLYISSLAAEKGYCHAGNIHLSEKFEIDDKTISRKISKLQSLGYIDIEYKMRGCEVIYRHIYLIDSPYKTRVTKKSLDEGRKNHSTGDEKVTDNNTRKNNTRQYKKSLPERDKSLLENKIYFLNILVLKIIEVFYKNSYEYKTSKDFLYFNLDKPQIQHYVKTQGEENVLAAWCDEIRKLKEIDGYNETQITYIIKFVKSDDFWSNQIISMSKFREKNKQKIPFFVEMIGKVKEEAEKQQKKKPIIM